ncbi:hypothetical protein D3C78_1116580 [compost metagenome]
MLLRIGDHFCTTRELLAEGFETPWSDNTDLRRQSSSRQLEADLIVPFARCSVGDCSCAFCACNINHTLRDQWAGNGRAEQILTLIQGSCLEHWIDKVLGEFLTQIIDIYLRCTCCQCLFFQSVKLLLLSDIGCEGDNFRIVGFFQPFEDNRGIQAAGISEHDFFFCHSSC